MLLGAIIATGIGYGVYAIGADEITYGNTTVKSALDELYQNTGSGTMGVSHIQLSSTSTYQLPSFPDYTWVSDSNTIQISNGVATVSGLGSVYLEKNNSRYFKLELEYVGPAVTLLAGKYCSNNSCFTGSDAISNNLFELLTDGIKTIQGAYDTILIASGDRYLKFTVSKPIDITFSSGHYSDGGGSSGKTANFYKLDNNNQEVLYTSFTQQDDTQDYATEHFEVGTYVVRAASNYVTFSEWIIVED